MPRQGFKRQAGGYRRPGREARHRAHRQSGTALIFAVALILFGLFTEATAEPAIARFGEIWMVDIDSLAKQEGLSTSWKPVERRFQAEGKLLRCSFALGFSYIFANGDAIKLSSPAVFQNDIVWVPAKESAEIFGKAFSKNYTLDTAAKVLTASAPAVKVAAKTVPVKAVPVKTVPAKTIPAKTVPAEAAALPVAPKKNSPAGSRPVKNIVIDPGHGGKDPGAIGKISNEKDIVLTVGKLLKKELVSRGFNVKLTRDTDKFIQLSERPQIANNWNGDLFISLHCNAIDGPRKAKVNGFRIYVLRDPESEEDRAIARRENKVATLYGDKNSKDELSPLDWLKIQARLEQYKQASYTFTEKVIEDYGRGKIKKMGSGAGGAGFMVLVGAFMPATLIEIGFISNPEEERYLNSEKGQKDIAKKIADGVENYRTAIERYLETLSH